MPNAQPTPSPNGTPPDRHVLPLATEAVHAGEARFRSHHSLTVPITQTAVYTFESCAALEEFFEERMFWEVIEREEYGRYGNPTLRAAEAKLAALEGGQDAILVGSGMSAVAMTLLILLQAGDHLVLSGDCYRSTLELCTQFLPKRGIDCTVVPFDEMASDYGALEAAIQPNTRLIFTESPTNPFLRCVDFAQFVDIAQRHKLLTAIDATFATPVNLRPLEHGVDIVIQSVTKYLAGHNDLLAGAIIGSFDVTTRLRQAHSLFGSIVDPHQAYLILRGVKTLALRMQQHNANGEAVARFLSEHQAVRQVWYPALKNHPDHKVATRTMHGFGGVVSFELHGEGKEAKQRAHRFIDALQIPSIGPSLGGVESMVSPLAVMGYHDLAPAQRESLGIKDELVRLCCGIEDTEELVADVAQALEQAG